MKKLMIAAMAAATMFATPVMAGDAEHDANEAIKAEARCQKALKEYLDRGTGYNQVVYWCGW